MSTSLHATVQSRPRAVGGPPMVSAGGSIGSSSKEGFHITTKRFVAAAVLIVGSSLAPHVAQAQRPEINRTELMQHDLSVPGREVVQVLVEIPPGVTFPRHSHPGEELVYVTEGALEYRLDGRPPETLEAGDVLFIPAGTPHEVTNVGSVNAAELATYIVEKGKPLLVLASERPGGDRVP